MIKSIINHIIPHLKNWGELYLLALLFSMVLYWFVEATDKKPKVQPGYTPVTTVVEKGKTYSQYEVEELTKAQMKAFKDSLLLTLKGEVKVITSTIVRVDTHFVNVPVKTDSTNFLVEINDPYLQLTVEGDIKKKTSSVQISLEDTINFAIIERTPLFSRRTVKATVFNTNPYISPVYGTGAILKERRNILSVGPYVGYDVITQQPSIGVAVMVPVLTIKSRK